MVHKITTKEISLNELKDIYLKQKKEKEKEKEENLIIEVNNNKNDNYDNNINDQFEKKNVFAVVIV